MEGDRGRGKTGDRLEREKKNKNMGRRKRDIEGREEEK